MPAAALDAVDDAVKCRHVGGAAEMFDKIEAYAAHAAAVEFFVISVDETIVDNGDAAKAFGIGCEAIEHRSIVGAVATRLHDHGAVDAKVRVQRRPHFLWRVLRRVATARRIRKLVARPEHVAVRVAGVLRQFEGGLAAFCEKGWLDVHRLPLAKRTVRDNPFRRRSHRRNIALLPLRVCCGLELGKAPVRYCRAHVGHQRLVVGKVDGREQHLAQNLIGLGQMMQIGA